MNDQPDQNGQIHLVPIANPQQSGGIVVSAASVKSEPQNSQTNIVQMSPNVQYIQQSDTVQQVKYT